MGNSSRDSSESSPHVEKGLLEDIEGADDLKPTKSQFWKKPSIRYSLLIPWTLCVVFLAIAVFQLYLRASQKWVPYWTPSDLVTMKRDFPAYREQVRFDAGLRFNKNKELYRTTHAGPHYVGMPSEQLDANWKELIGAINILITPFEAASLDPGMWHDPETQLYMAQPTVFHDLHCLNMLRKNARFYGEYYDEHKNDTIVRTHLDHCIDSLRLSLMCTGDMTMSPIVWSEEKGRIIPNFEVEHTCRDYKSLKRWANDRDGGTTSKYAENAERLKASET